MIYCVHETSSHRVLDGGSLLHRIPWKHGTRFWKNSERLRGRIDHQIRHVSQKRTQYTVHAVVSFTAETDFSGKKEEFLSRDTTKQSVIPMKENVMRLTNISGDATMRYRTFSNKMVSSFVTTERLLSTECVTKLHFCRAFLQPHNHSF